VVDRFVQQAVLQVLQRRWDPTFSAHSYGFRPGRSAKQAVRQAQQYIAEGYRWVVDLDLEKFFDRVNHNRLLAAVAERVADKRMLKLIRAFLKAGMMEDGLVSPVDEGTPQGGPLSPMLSILDAARPQRELVQFFECHTLSRWHCRTSQMSTFGTSLVIDRNLTSNPPLPEPVRPVILAPKYPVHYRVYSMKVKCGSWYPIQAEAIAVFERKCKRPWIAPPPTLSAQR
jgi:hypothetical protein